MRSFRLLLIRCAAVVASSAVFATTASLLLPDLKLAVVAWLLPSLALSSTSLALSTRIPPLVAAGAIGTVWVLIVGLVSFEVRDALVPFGPPTQIACLALAAASFYVLLRKRESFEQKAIA